MASYSDIKAKSEEIRSLLRSDSRVDGEELFYLMQILAFMIHSTPVDKISPLFKLQKHRFAFRKLKSVLSLLDKVFGA